MLQDADGNHAEYYIKFFNLPEKEKLRQVLMLWFLMKLCKYKLNHCLPVLSAGT